MLLFLLLIVFYFAVAKCIFDVGVGVGVSSVGGDSVIVGSADGGRDGTVGSIGSSGGHGW